MLLMHRALIMLGLAAAGARPALAQDDSMPITVTAKPRLAPPGTPIKLSGTTVADGHRFDVKITIAFPANGEHMERIAHVDTAGAYAITIPNLRTAGDYKVAVLAPDGRGHDTTSFKIGDEEEVLSDLMDAMHDILEDAATVERHLADDVKSLPESPAKRQLQDKIAVLDDSLAQQPARLKTYRDVMERFGNLRRTYPDAEPIFRDLYVNLSDAAQRDKAQADARSAEVLRQLDASRAAGQLCDRLEAAAEGFRAVGAMFNLGGELMGITRGFLTDYVAGKFGPMLTQPPLSTNTTFQLGLSSAVKLGVALMSGPTGWVGFVVGFAADVAAAAMDKEFNKYCDRFEGPFNATMHGEVYHEDLTWWTFDERLEGRLTLRYPKTSTPGQAIHMSGQFEGAATDYKVWDDALPALYPKLMRAARTYKRTLKPVGVPLYDVEGRYAAQASPTAFYIPVEGELVGTKLTLHVQTATKDIPSEYNTARVVVLVLSPLTLVPVLVRYNLPYEPGEFVLTHGMEVDEHQPLELDVEIGNQTMQARRHWERTKPGDGVKAVYTAALRLCNPACQGGGP